MIQEAKLLGYKHGVIAFPKYSSIFGVFYNFIYIKNHRIKIFAHTPNTANHRQMKCATTMFSMDALSNVILAKLIHHTY